MDRYLLVDGRGRHVGVFESDSTAWSAGVGFFDNGGRCYTITAIVMSAEPDTEFRATWVVSELLEPAVANR